MVAAVSLPIAPETYGMRIMRPDDVDDARRVPPPKVLPRASFDLTALPKPKPDVFSAPKVLRDVPAVNPRPEVGHRWSYTPNIDGKGRRTRAVVAHVAPSGLVRLVAKKGGHLVHVTGWVRPMMQGSRGWKFLRAGKPPKTRTLAERLPVDHEVGWGCEPQIAYFPAGYTDREEARFWRLVRKGESPERILAVCSVHPRVTEHAKRGGEVRRRLAVADRDIRGKPRRRVWRTKSKRCRDRKRSS